MQAQANRPCAKCKIYLCIIIALFLIIGFPKPVYATVDAVWSGEFVLRVDGRDYSLWGYSTDMAIHYFCLFDMAYILNGTPAQFNVRRSAGEEWDFWIVRGAAFEVVGQEFVDIPLFREIPERSATRADGGGLFGWEWDGSGFLRYPEQTFVLGIDGETTPATSIAIRTITDIDNVYFMLSELAYILGFEHVITTSRWHWGDWHDDFISGVDRIIDTSNAVFPALRKQSPELVRNLIALSGHWVASAFFDSAYIDETIVWPVEIAFDYSGMYRPLMDTLSPITPMWTTEVWEEMRQTLSPVYSNQLPELVFELTPIRQDEFPDYRIVFQLQGEPIDIITLYIGDTAHQLRRHYDRWMDTSRYTIQAMQGDVLLRYIPRRWFFSNPEEADIRVYRVTEGQRTLLHRQTGVRENDRILFEFIDQSPIPGAIHYYEIVRMNQGWTELATDPIRVDVYALLGLVTEPNDYPKQDNYANEDTPADEPNIAPNQSGVIMWIVIAAIVLGAVFAFIIRKHHS
ncbi:MAG: hypothetical protein FWC16_10740 [Defluviitaleaceae bacterium]|nr:hypothetical protein [Defluviitaleaceae bacterium]MCL2189762.1 hypothetical protein [Defluviitaleaceae bacterium]MCL2275394.1 hypothetical protein [Defluviitaleaceae bacterium]